MTHTDASRSPVLDPDGLAQMILIALAINAPAFGGDDAWLFNYLNNVVDARPLYFKNGYVHVIPQLTSYALSGQPLVAQAVLYRIVPIVVVVILYRQLRTLFAAIGNRQDAWLPALAITLIIRVVEPAVFGELSYATWSACLAALIYVVRIDLTNARYTWPGIIAVLLATLSLPLGLLIAPLWLAHAAYQQDARRWTNVTLAALVIAANVAVFAFATEQPAGAIGPRRALEMFVDGFRQEKRDNLIVIASLLAIGVRLAAHPLIASWIAPRAGARVARWSLAWFGVGSVVLYASSNRFIMQQGNFIARFALPVMFSALVMLAMDLASVAGERTRGMLSGVALGAAGALVLVLLYTQLRGPLETSLMRYQFVAVAAEFRRTCRDHDAMIFEATDSSPAVLCRRQQLPVGFFEMRDVPPSIGAGAGPFDDVPGFFVYQPLW
jgi:hypothetical protein